MCFIGEITRFQPWTANIQMATKSSLTDNKHETFLANRAIIVQSKNINFVWVGMQDFREGQVEK